MSRNGDRGAVQPPGGADGGGWEAMVCLDDPARHRLSRRRSV